MGAAIAATLLSVGLAACIDTDGAPIDAATGVTSKPIVPRGSRTSTTFEGFAVRSVIPANPKGLVFVFHGSHGSAAVVDKVEATDALNELEARGYGWVATESTERTGDQRWDVQHAQFANNPDLQRLERLWSHLVATTPVSSTTPLYGIGMSNGARFVALWSDVAEARRPIRAAAVVMGSVPPSVGTVSVPTQFVIADNDTTAPNSTIAAQYRAARDAGTPVSWFRIGERRSPPAASCASPGSPPPSPVTSCAPSTSRGSPTRRAGAPSPSMRCSRR